MDRATISHSEGAPYLIGQTAAPTPLVTKSDLTWSSIKPTMRIQMARL